MVSSTDRLIDEDGLEAPFQGGILFDMFSIFIECRRADQMQFAAGQHGLEQVGGIHGSFGRSRSDDRMQLIDEQQDLPLRGLDLLQTAFNRSSNSPRNFAPATKRSHVEHHDAFLLQSFRHVAFDDADGQSFDDRGLADAGFADQHGIVLRSP